MNLSVSGCVVCQQLQPVFQGISRQGTNWRTHKLALCLRCCCHIATRTSAVTGNRSGLVKRFHGARQSRILAGDPLAGWKKKRDKLFVPRLRSTNSLSLFFFHPARGPPARILDCCANLAALASASLLQSNSSDWWLAVLASTSFCRNS